jgi:starch phosphorylase
MNNKNKSVVAYFSMEIAVASDIKTYAGGLGVLAGDILRSAADSGFPMVGVTLLNRQGYFKQTIAASGEQIVQPDSHYDFSHLKKLSRQITVKIGTEPLQVGVWQYIIKGRLGSKVLVYFLDTDLDGNKPSDRQLTGQLYGGDQDYRLKQEIILGRGGVKMLRALGYKEIDKFHLNEGHGALAAVELFVNSRQKSQREKLAEVRRHCVFTTHTPLKKEQDVYLLSHFLEYQPDFPKYLNKLGASNEVSMTILGLYFSRYANAVSLRHQEVSRRMFPGYKIKEVTNGVNSLTWTAPEFKRLYDKYLAGWRADNSLLSQAGQIPIEKIYLSHQRAKQRLLAHINGLTPKGSAGKLSAEIFTLGFARRFTPYKRPEFLFKNLTKLLAAQERGGRIQIIYAGKAHPHDLEGQAIIKLVEQTKKELGSKISLVFLEDYDLRQAQLLVAGVDLWLNTPLPPNEASGTSGMKAAHNGVPQLSTADGWWLEGYRQGETGWLIKENKKTSDSNLYDLLEREILPAYYHDPEKWGEIMRGAICFNAAYFNTQRVLKQYIKEAYRTASGL